MGEPLLMPGCARRDLLVAVLLLAAPGAVSADAAPPDELRPPFRVDRIELRLDAPPGRDVDLIDELEIGVGETATSESIRRSLGNLLATGVVAGAEILARSESDGSTTAIVVVRSHTWVEEVEIVGELGRPRDRLLDLVPQRPLTPLFEDRILRGFFALQDELARHGYRSARVRVEVVPVAARGGRILDVVAPLRHDSKRVLVRYRIEAGPRSRIRAVELAGDLGGRSPAELREPLDAEAGQPYDRDRVQGDVDRLRKWLIGAGHLTARVGRAELAWGDGPDDLIVTFPVTAGPRLEVVVDGIERRRIRDVLPFLRGESFDLSQLPGLERRLRTLLQDKGYWRGRAEIEVEGDGPVRTLRVTVDTGEKYRIAEVRIDAGDQLAESDLEDLLATGESNPLIPGSGHLVDDTLEEDVQNLRSWLALRGFFRSEVEPPAIEVDEEGNELTVLIRVEPGPRRRIVELEVTGVEALDEETLRAQLPIQPGGPFHPVLVEDAVGAIRAVYEQEGYPLVAVAADTQTSADGTLVDVSLRVEEGPRRTIDRILIRGHQRTRTEVIRRSMSLDSGDPIHRLGLLTAERELYRLGIFRRVDVDVAPSTELDEDRDVLVRVEEARRFRIGYGVSYHSEDGVGGLFSASAANLLGRADRLQLDLRSTGDERRVRFAYSQPNLGRLRLPVTFTVYRQEDERESFLVDDRGLQLAVTKELRPWLRLALASVYKIVELSEEATDPLQLEREDREVEIASLTSTLLVDRRDDPLEPTRGWSATLQAEVAEPIFRADADFGKFFWQQTGIVGLGRLGRLVGSLRFGAIEPDDRVDPDPVVPDGLPSARVPISERFFAGGRTTHRAYERDRLGIVGQTLIPVASGEDEPVLVEIGGNGLALANLDWRFPIAGAVGGTVFADYGNVWADWRDIDPSEGELGVGVGVRYLSPVGPVRFEVGWKVDPLPGARNPVFLLSFGNPF